MKKWLAALLIAALTMACAKKEPERVKDPSRKVILSVVLIGYKYADAPPGTPRRTSEEARALSQKLYTDLKAGTLTFDQAVSASDDAQSKEHLGYLNVFRFGDLPLDVEAAVFALQPGEFTPPMDARIGWAVYRRDVENIRGVNHILISYKGAQHAPLAISRTREQALEAAQSARKELLTGKPFAEVARKYSNGLEAKRDGYLGWMTKNVLLPEHRDAVWALKQKEPSNVLESPIGFHIYQTIPPWPDTVGVKHIMVAYQGALLAPFSITRSKEEARTLAKDIRERLLKGEDWDATVRKFSDDTSTAKSSGDLGIIPLNVIPAELEGVAFTLPLNRISDVVESPGGFHILLRYK